MFYPPFACSQSAKNKTTKKQTNKTHTHTHTHTHTQTKLEQCVKYIQI